MVNLICKLIRFSFAVIFVLWFYFFMTALFLYHFLAMVDWYKTGETDFFKEMKELFFYVYNGK